MESRDPVFQFVRTASLNLAPLAGIRTSGLARTGVADPGGGAVKYDPPDGVRRNRNQMLVLGAPPDISVRMIGEPSRSERERSSVHMTRYQFQQQRDQGQGNSVSKH